LIPDGAIGFFH